MTKRYSGYIGIRQEPVETAPGVYSTEIREVKVKGDITPKSARWSAGELSQDSIRANHLLTIIAPEDAIADALDVVYVTWLGRKWVVVSVEYIHPSLTMSLGGEYNGG